MAIKGIEGMSFDEVNLELQNGAKFVVFHYNFSLVIISFKRTSDVYFLRPDESGFSKGLSYTLFSLLFGWWGFPWGLIYTIQSLITNLRGGRDVTAEVIASLNEAGATEPTTMTPLVCPQCQLENQAGRSFCTGCGTPL